MRTLIPIFLRLTGLALLLAGLLGVYYGPLEIYVFYLFSEGGRFNYDGFGVGSLWFAYLVAQNLGYYIVAAVCLPLGLGHLGLRRWALTLARLYLWFWLAAGILLAWNWLWLSLSTTLPDLTQAFPSLQLQAIGWTAFVAMIVLPVLGLGFYYSTTVGQVFEEHDPKVHWTERYPFRLLALQLFFLILILVLHLAVFFQGIFPLFGRLLLGRSSAYILSACVLAAVVLMYGIARQKIWAWWGSLVFLSLLSVSTWMTFSRYRFYDIILRMNLPGAEIDFLNRLNRLQDVSLVWMFTPALLAALGLTLASRRDFSKGL